MRVIAAINTSLDAGLSVRTLFEAPTVAQLAPHIGGDAARRRAAGGGCAACGGAVVVCPEPVVVPQRFEGGIATYNIPTAFRIVGPLDVEALGAALDDVIARHESLRTTFPDIDGVPCQEVLAAEAGMWRRGAAVLSLREQDVAGELATLAGYRFDLSAEVPDPGANLFVRSRAACGGNCGAPHRFRRLVLGADGPRCGRGV